MNSSHSISLRRPGRIPGDILVMLFRILLVMSVFSQDDVNPFAEAQAAEAAAPILKVAEFAETQLVSEIDTIAPGEKFVIGFEITHSQGYHSYYINPGTVGLPLKASWTLPNGFSVKRVGWPTPHLVPFFGINTLSYENSITHLFEVTPPSDLPVGTDLSISLSAGWQVCDDLACIPDTCEHVLSFKTASTSTPNGAGENLIKEARSHYPQSLSSETKTEAVENDGTITLTLEPAPQLDGKTISFFDYDSQIDIQEKQSVATEGNKLVLILKRPSADNPSISSGEALDTIRGILTDGQHSYYLETPRLGEATIVAEKASEVHLADSEEDIAEMTKLYDVESKIDFVRLGGTKQAVTTIWTALFGAFVGGMLLNLMPCVFPVLGLKVMSFVKQSDSDPRKIRLHGLAFAGGLIASMWVLASVILILKISMGQDVVWGQQMGNPFFLGAIILLLFVLGLNMAGVFEIGTSLTSAGQNVKKDGYSGSFMSGVLTTLIATPCSGPFLGTAMGYTLAQPAATALILFTIFGLGISAPYLFLAFFPKLIQKLPKPGAWMETFKITMSFALFATVAFFLKSFGSQTGIEGLSILLMALVIIGLALYFYGHWSQPYRKAPVRLWAGTILPAVIALGGGYMALQAMKKEGPALEKEGWVAWNPGKVEHSRVKGRIVWVDYTAEW